MLQGCTGSLDFGILWRKGSSLKIESIFQGAGSGAEDVGGSFWQQRTALWTGFRFHNVVPVRKGRILSNSVLTDKAQSVFKGMIRIGKEAKNSNAYLAGHAILLSEDAKSDAIPRL